MSLIKIIENGEIYAPDYIGKKNLIISDKSISEISETSSDKISGLDVQVIDASGKYVLPGFIDNHVHICGGGGEGGFKTRTPEISLSSITTAGITSLIGVLGTDGTTRTMSNLIAKANALIEEGLSAWVLTGSYQVPVRTLTGSITDDIILIERIVGCGEISLSDHRSSHPSLGHLIRLISDTRLGGILSGKAGIVNIHMGDSRNTVDLLLKVVENSEIPISQMLPTHMNRNPWLFQDAIKYALKGGNVDFTTSTTAQFLSEGEVSCGKALKFMLEKNIPVDQITFSSDGQGSLPLFDDKGVFAGLTVGKSSSLFSAVCQAYREFGIDFSTALKTITSNPANRYKLHQKGYLKTGFDADIVLVDRNTLEIDTVIAKGQTMVEGGKVIVKGTFEE